MASAVSAAAAAAAGAAMHLQQQKQEQYEWPAVSFARMRAGLRSVLKTECSGFKFQNGGRSLRWFREHPDDASERGHLFWQGHVSLFRQSWEFVRCRDRFALFLGLYLLDGIYRKRYSVRDPASHTPDRSHIQAMFNDGNVERALRWVLGRRRGAEHAMLFCGLEETAWYNLIAMALQGGWTWLLEPWQAEVESIDDVNAWREMLIVGAIETGSLALVQMHWQNVQREDRATVEILKAIGRSGSLDVFGWLASHGFVPSRKGHSSEPWCPLECTALMCGHVDLLDAVCSRDHSIARTRLDKMDTSLLFSYAGARGSMRSVEWLVSRAQEPDGRFLPCAVAGGHLHILRYLRERFGVSGNHLLERSVETLVSRSRPGCLSVLEYLVQHYHYQPTSQHIARAATAANVRPDVLRFLALHAPQEVWSDVLADDNVRDDLDVQDLLHATARDVGQQA